MEKLFRFIPFAILIIVLMACSSTRTLTVDDNGKNFEVNPQAKLYIKLDGNLTTGYQWQILEMDNNVIELIGEPEYKTENTSLTGAGGSFIFHLRGKNTGQTTVKLGYMRPWETSVEPIEMYEVTIVVKSS